MAEGASERIRTLDLIRGVAVLGILAVNIAGFAGPSFATLTPNYPAPGSSADQWVFGATILLFEGKMRALFSILFGAGMVLFMDRAEARGRDSGVHQARRLGWLLLFGYLHFTLLWSGDILFAYAFLGLVALALRHMDERELWWGALAFYLLWHMAGAIISFSPLANAPGEIARGLADRATQEAGVLTGGYGAMVLHRLTEQWFHPLDGAISSLGETVPLMAMGMVLQLRGFFSGVWPRARVQTIAVWCSASGAILTLAFLGWALPHRFPAPVVLDYMLYWSALPHLLMALGYAAVLVLVSPRLGEIWLGRRLGAAGRMAFSNYLGTSLVMCLLFNGWGLGLALRFGTAELFGFVLLGWALMLGWSEPWLRHFRQGPLEWAWRSLTEWQWLPFRREGQLGL